MAGVTRRDFLQSSVLATATGAAGPHLIPSISFAALATMFEAGVATREITPAPGAPLWGYSDAERLAEGVISPLYAKSIVFRVGDKAVGLVVLDLGRMPLPSQCARIREEVKARGIEHVIFSATHTHSAPFMELDLPHVEPILQAITECLEEAAANLQPARIGVGTATVDISHNRRLIRDGKCYMLWRNAERQPTEPVDHEATIIRIDAAGGKPMAALVHYACHPVIFGPDNKQYSADWPGEMCGMVKAATGAECFFLQGGAGDINPNMDKTPLAEGGLELMQQEGRRAADAVIKAYQQTEAIPPKAPSLAYREERVNVGTRYDLKDPRQQEILKQAYDKMYDFYMAPFAENPTVPVGVLLLNNSLALPCLPGEFFVQFQLDMKQKSPLANTLLCGYTNEFHIYFPTIKDAAIGGYGASTATYVSVGAGEQCVNHALKLIGEMTGQLGPLKGVEDFRLLEIT